MRRIALPVIQNPGTALPPSCLSRAERPAVDKLVGQVFVLACRVEQLVAHRHRHGRPEQRDSISRARGCARPLRAQRANPENDRRARRARHPQRRAARRSSLRSPRRMPALRPRNDHGPASRRRGRCIRDARNSATAMPRRCGRARRRGRTRRSAASPTNVTRRRCRRRLRSRRRREPHCATRSPCLRRAARGSGPRSGRPRFSRPIDRRIVPSVIPAFASSAADIRKCVVLAGWMTSDFASPTLARCEKSLQCLDELASLRASSREIEAEYRSAARRAEAFAQARDPDDREAPDTRPPPPARALARKATTLRVFSTCRAMRSGSVSIPCRIWNAVNGAMHAPKSRMPSRRARSRKAAVVDSSLNTMS